MINVVGSKDDPSKWKPANLQDHKTMGELSAIVGRTITRIKQAEKEGKLPIPIRVPVGALQVRLYSPAQVEQINTHFQNARKRRADK